MAGYGLKLARNAGAGFTAELTDYPIATSYTGKIAQGDLVRLVSGYIQEASGNAAGNFADTDVIGVFAGCQYSNVDGYHFTNYFDGVAGKTDITASIIPAYGRRFYIKGSSGVTWTAADVGTSRKLIWATPNATYRESRVTLGAAAVVSGVSNNGHAFIHALAPLPRNGYTAAGVTEPVFEVTLSRIQGGLAVPYVTT